MPDETQRLPEPEVYVTWVGAPEEPRYELPITPARAVALAESLNEYAKRCIAVKTALETVGDNGIAYKRAQDMKHHQWSAVFGVVETILAHIAVHAR